MAGIAFSLLVFANEAAKRDFRNFSQTVSQCSSKGCKNFHKNFYRILAEQPIDAMGESGQAEAASRCSMYQCLPKIPDRRHQHQAHQDHNQPTHRTGIVAPLIGS
jgi:hypothetical protein